MENSIDVVLKSVGKFVIGFVILGYKFKGNEIYILKWFFGYLC